MPKAHLLAGARAAVLALAAIALAAADAPKPPKYLAAAIEARDRRADAPADARRHPAAILTLAGVKPGWAVAELIPGSGYWTRLISHVVGPAGRVYAIWPEEYAKLAHPDPERLRALAQTRTYRNVTVLIQPARAFSTPSPVDLVFTSQNYHDYPDKFMGSLDPELFDRQVYRALKRGGVFLVIDHMAEPGSGLRDTERLHRVDLASVKAQAVAAGFTYAGASAALRNPADDHSRPVFDPSIRGRTDQFVLKFRKP